jgi:hypothetical protein
MLSFRTIDTRISAGSRNCTKSTEFHFLALFRRWRYTNTPMLALAKLGDLESSLQAERLP